MAIGLRLFGEQLKERDLTARTDSHHRPPSTRTLGDIEPGLI